MKKLIEMPQKRFGRLFVICRAENDKTKKPTYLCKCDCGKTTVVRGKLLRNGHTKSCGCLRYERLAMSIKKHGYSMTSIYNIWSGMKDRCTT